MIDGEDPLRILMVLTSHERLGDTERRTGFRLESFAAAFYVLEDSGIEVVLASLAGGQPPIDPISDAPEHQTDLVKRFKQDRNARTMLADTLRLDQAAPEDFDGAFYVGGHGALWDLVVDRTSLALIHALHHAEKPIALVCHGQAALRHATGVGGRPLVEGRRLTAPSNSEEAAAGMAGIVPFLLQDELIRLGAHYGSGPDWAPYVVRDGTLITGQNPRSSADAANLLVGLLRC